MKGQQHEQRIISKGHREPGFETHRKWQPCRPGLGERAHAPLSPPFLTPSLCSALASLMLKGLELSAIFSVLKDRSTIPFWQKIACLEVGPRNFAQSCCNSCQENSAHLHRHMPNHGRPQVILKVFCHCRRLAMSYTN